uniref:Uncharacterized protein n=1 Tax=Fundulus heteroclitus TaxID=8078 RepID=A0A3Q2PBH6_FUNHE
MSLTHRECTVRIQNKTSSFILRDPRVHLQNGNCAIPLPPDLCPTESGTALFKKMYEADFGSEGVFMYNIVHKSTNQELGQLAVMFSILYESDSNDYAVGEFSDIKQCDDELYQEMWSEYKHESVRGEAKGPSLTHKGSHVTIRASMSDTNQAVLKVDICDN